MAKVLNAVEILRKISTALVRRTSVTDDRQTTDGRATANSEREREFTFAKNRDAQKKRPNHIKAVESVLRSGRCLWCEILVKEVGLEPGVKDRGSYGC